MRDLTLNEALKEHRPACRMLLGKLYGYVRKTKNKVNKPAWEVTLIGLAVVWLAGKAETQGRIPVADLPKCTPYHPAAPLRFYLEEVKVHMETSDE
jgi:hypothetical protein